MKEETKGLYLAILLSAIAILLINWIWPANEASLQKEETPVVAVEDNNYKNISSLNLSYRA